MAIIYFLQIFGVYHVIVDLQKGLQNMLEKYF